MARVKKLEHPPVSPAGGKNGGRNYDFVRKHNSGGVFSNERSEPFARRS
jgi:hypothetical protein